MDVEGPKIESSFTMRGRYKGEEGGDLGNYCSLMRHGEEGIMYGEGREVVTTKDGKGMATWTGQGIRRFTGPGKISFRGSLFFRATGRNLSSSNNVYVFSIMKWMKKVTALLRYGSGSRD